MFRCAEQADVGTIVVVGTSHAAKAFQPGEARKDNQRWDVVQVVEDEDESELKPLSGSSANDEYKERIVEMAAMAYVTGPRKRETPRFRHRMNGPR